MYYSETKVIMGGLAHVPILIFIVNFIKGKFASIALKVVEVKTEEPKLKKKSPPSALDQLCINKKVWVKFG